MFKLDTRILIVDDMVVLRKQMAKLFHELGYQDILEAGDGIEALQRIQNEAPPISLVISDYDMPNANGLDLYKRLHGDSRFKSVPFVLVGLEAEHEQLAQGIKAGVQAYLIKPFNVNDLRQMLENLHKKLGS